MTGRREEIAHREEIAQGKETNPVAEKAPEAVITVEVENEPDRSLAILMRVKVPDPNPEEDIVQILMNDVTDPKALVPVHLEAQV